MSSGYEDLQRKFYKYRYRMTSSMEVVSFLLLWLEERHPDKLPAKVLLTPSEEFEIEGKHTLISVATWGDMEINVYHENRPGWDRTIIGTVGQFDVNKLDPGIWKG